MGKESWIGRARIDPAVSGTAFCVQNYFPRGNNVSTRLTSGSLRANSLLIIHGWKEGRKEGRKQREDGGRLAKLTNKFSDTSNFNRSPLCLNALQIRCARVSQGTRTFACLFTTTTTVLAKSSRFSKDILPFHRPLAAFRFVLLIYFSPHDGSKRFLVKTIFREYVWRAQSRAFSSPPARTRDKRRGKTAVFLDEWKYRYEASVGMCVYVRVCVRNSRMHAAWWLQPEKGRRWKGRRVGLLSILPRVGGRKGELLLGCYSFRRRTYRSLSRVYFFETYRAG